MPAASAAILAYSEGAEPRRQLLALTLMPGSLAAVFVLAFAGYVESRSACFGTKYSAGWGLVYLTPDSEDWRNSAMARYCDIDSIIMDTE